MMATRCLEHLGGLMEFPLSRTARTQRTFKRRGKRAARYPHDLLFGVQVFRDELLVHEGIKLQLHRPQGCT
jgi:hypothetical protein